MMSLNEFIDDLAAQHNLRPSLIEKWWKEYEVACKRHKIPVARWQFEGWYVGCCIGER